MYEGFCGNYHAARVQTRKFCNGGVTLSYHYYPCLDSIGTDASSQPELTNVCGWGRLALLSRRRATQHL